MNILIFGISGSGKGTQANLISEKYNLKHFQSGDILRKIAGENTEFGQKVSKAMQKGFVPEEWILEIMQKEFSSIGSNQGIIIDGFSRKMPEIKLLLSILEKNNRKIDYIFVIDITEEEAMKRLLSRRICECGRIFSCSKDTCPCPDCGKNSFKRDDDNIVSIEKRINDYRIETVPVMDFLKNNGYEILNIDGMQSSEKVFNDICNKIEKNND